MLREWQSWVWRGDCFVSAQYEASHIVSNVNHLSVGRGEGPDHRHWKRQQTPFRLSSFNASLPQEETRRTDAALSGPVIFAHGSAISVLNTPSSFSLFSLWAWNILPLLG